MSSNPLQAAEALVMTVRTLASDDNYKAFASLCDEIPLLKGQIISKSKEVDDLREENVRLETRYEDFLRKNLELYRAERNGLEEEKAKLGKDISNLSTTIRAKDDAIAELNQKRIGLLGRLDLAKQSSEEEKKKVVTANAKITKLQQSLEAKDNEIDNLKEALGKSKTEVSNVEGQLQNVQRENASLQQKLRSTATRLDELEGFTVKLNDEDEKIWINQLDELWRSVRRLVETHFKDDLPEKILRDPEPWKRFRESQLLDRAIPLPQSNSSAAKQMRTAAVLAILARSIDKHIFQPTYFFDEKDLIRDLLVRLAVTNSKMESFCRALLLSIFPEEQARNATKAVRDVVREVGLHIQDLLPMSQYDSFRSGLEQVVPQALKVWYIVQHATERFEPNFELDRYEDVEWQPLEFEEVYVGANEERSKRTSDGDQELLVIFPRIFLIEDAEPCPITNGVVLMESQSAAAAEELERIHASSPTAERAAPRHRSNRSRNRSIFLNSGNHFL